jgi:hypothetical protein
MIIQLLSTACAILSAGLWGWAAFVKVPAAYDVLVTFDFPSDDVAGSEIIASGTSRQLSELAAALRWQSKLNSWGAATAASAAALQAIAWLG